MKKILLDTNLFIYIEDNKVTDEKILKLTKTLYDSSEYKIVIHPKTKEEIEKMSNEEQKKIFKSKIAVYKEIKNPPVPTMVFHNLIGCKNSHDIIDNNLLFAIKQNCASFLITNDNEIVKKAKKIGLDDKVLSIEDAIKNFSSKDNSKVVKPIFINEEFLYQIEYDDNFFDSLRADYFEFDKWFSKKQADDSKAYVTRNEKGQVTSFLMLKLEDEKETYTDFDKLFAPAKRLKISTIKVTDTGKRIGETFIKIIIQEALINKVDEVYVTVFEKHKYLIELLEEYGFNFFTYKNTKNGPGESVKETVFLKKMNNSENYYPYINVIDKKIFIIPIKEKYHRLLFQEADKKLQLSIDDLNGTNTASNSLKKSYICNSNTKKIIPGSIVIFYASEEKKAITSLGVVDAVFNSFEDCDELIKLVKKRTAYQDTELRKKFKPNSLVILFKHYWSFPNRVGYDYLLRSNIINGTIQTVTEIDYNGFVKIIDECKVDKNLINFGNII